MHGNFQLTGIFLRILFNYINQLNNYSATGKRLMAKCRQLHQENEELGKMISSGKIAQLEGNLAMHTNYSEEVKKTQSGM